MSPHAATSPARQAEATPPAALYELISIAPTGPGTYSLVVRVAGGTHPAAEEARLTAAREAFRRPALEALAAERERALAGPAAAAWRAARGRLSAHRQALSEARSEARRQEALVSQALSEGADPDVHEAALEEARRRAATLEGRTNTLAVLEDAARRAAQKALGEALERARAEVEDAAAAAQTAAQAAAAQAVGHAARSLELAQVRVTALRSMSAHALHALPQE